VNQQTLLSEQLQLMHLMPRSGRDGGPLFKLSDKEHRELEILDALALYLDRDGEEDTIAVALDKTSAVRCVLAKLIPPDAEDLNYVKKFFSAMSTFQSPVDFISFALEHTLVNVRKKIRKVSEIELTVVDQYIEEHQFREGQEEFNSVAIDIITNQFGKKWNLSALEPKLLLRRAYIEAKTMASKLASLDTDITQTSLLDLLRVVYIVVHSNFGSYYGHEATVDSSPQLNKIRKRFDKLSQYNSGAVGIHHYGRQLFPDGAEIPYVWI